MTKGELLDRVSSSELVEWMALWKIRAEERKKAAQRRRH